MVDIKKLLNKKGWTGRELGIIELTNMSELYRQALEGKPNPKPLVDPAQFQKMINGIVERAQGAVYNGYVAIHEWVQVQLNVALSQEQQLQLQVKTLMDYATNATTAENAYKYVEQLPAIMTQREYDEKRAAAIEAQLVGEDGKDTTWNIFHIVAQAIFFFVDELEKYPKKPNPLKPIKKKYGRELVTSQYILDNWNRVTGAGYTTLEEGLTKWQVLEAGLYEFYPDHDHGKEAEAASIKDFYTEFGELIKAVISEIDGGEWLAERLADIPLEDWHKYTVPVRALYEGGYYGMQELIEKHSSLWQGNQRALLNGIAIYSPSPVWLENMEQYGTDEEHKRHYAKLDERGYYVPPDIKNSLHELSLEAFFTDGEGYAHNVEIVEHGRQALLDSYYYIKGYNIALDMIADCYDVPAITVFKIDIEYLEKKMDAFNALVPELYAQIYKTDYEDKELKRQKLQVIKDIFYPLDYKKLTIPEESVEEVRGCFKDFAAFKERYTVIQDKLCTRPEADDSEEGGAEC